MSIAVFQYFDRAAWALHNATNDALPPKIRSHLAAMAVHACRSLTEALEQVLADAPDDAELLATVHALPHVKLIEASEIWTCTDGRFRSVTPTCR